MKRTLAYIVFAATLLGLYSTAFSDSCPSSSCPTTGEFRIYLINPQEKTAFNWPFWYECSTSAGDSISKGKLNFQSTNDVNLENYLTTHKNARYITCSLNAGKTFNAISENNAINVAKIAFEVAPNTAQIYQFGVINNQTRSTLLGDASAIRSKGDTNCYYAYLDSMNFSGPGIDPLALSINMHMETHGTSTGLCPATPS